MDNNNLKKRQLIKYLWDAPYVSWTLNQETAEWEAPVPYSTDGERYLWNEEELEWILETPEPVEPAA
jgi:hypothetical protein